MHSGQIPDFGKLYVINPVFSINISRLSTTYLIVISSLVKLFF